MLVNVRGRSTWTVDPRSHPITLEVLPKEIDQGSWVEPWSLESFPDPFPEGKGPMRVPDSAGPIHMTALVFPFAEAWGNLYSVRVPFQEPFPQGLFFDGPEGQFQIRWWGWEQRSDHLLAGRNVRTEVRTSLTEQSQIQKTSPGGDVIWIPFGAPEVAFPCEVGIHRH